MRGVQRNDGLEHLVNSAKELKNRCSHEPQSAAHGHSIAQRWVEGDLALYLDVAIRRDAVEGETEYWCAYVQRTGLSGEPLHVGDGPTGGHVEVELGLVEDGWDQHSMLVLVRELLEPAHSLRTIPATVRLVPADDLPVLVRDSREPLVDFLSEGLAGFGHRKIDFVRTRWPWFAPDPDESPSEMVERCPEVLKHVPKRESAVRAKLRQLRNSDQADSMTAMRFDLRLEGDGIDLRFKAPFDRCVYALQVFTGPVVLSPGTTDRVICHLRQSTQQVARPEPGSAHTSTERGS